MERLNLTDDSAMTSAARTTSTSPMPRLFRMPCEESCKTDGGPDQLQHGLPVAVIPPGTRNRDR
jgi:hypothetical protein